MGLAPARSGAPARGARLLVGAGDGAACARDRRTAARTAADALFQPFVAEVLPGVDSGHPPHIGFESGASGLDWMRNATNNP